MKTRLLFILCLVLSNYLMAQNSWTLSNTGFEEGFCVNDFVTTESNNLFAVGAKTINDPNFKLTSFIYQSSDNGVSWHNIDTFNYFSNQYIKSICSVGDTLVLYANPAMYKSGDNGNSWTQINKYLYDYDDYNDFTALNKNTIFAACRVNMCCPTLIYPAVYKSTNIWRDWSMNTPSGYNDNYYYNEICAIGNTLLLGVSKKNNSCYIYISVDEGSTWTINDDFALDFKITGFAVTESNVVYAIGTQNSSPAIYKSANTGDTWEKVDTTGLFTYNYTFNGIGAVGNTILLSTENKNKNYAVFRFQDRTSINDLMEADDFKVYPNPFNDFITIKNNSQSSQKIKGIEILSINGAILKCFNSNFDKLNITDLTPGIYILKINTDNKSHLIKVVKMNR